MTEQNEGSSGSPPKGPQAAAAFVRKLFEDRRAWESADFRAWAQYRFELLKDFHIAQDVEHLVSAGVAIQTLAVATMLINIAPSFDYLLKKHLGDKRTREKKIEALTDAIPVVEEFEELYRTVTKGQAPEEFLKTFDPPPPSSVIAALQSYSLILASGELVFEFLEVSSFLEVAKYALAACVREVTGHYHDREVSALTGAALQNFDYDETAHRVWRIRGFERLSGTKAVYLPAMLKAMNDVVTRTL